MKRRLYSVLVPFLSFAGLLVPAQAQPFDIIQFKSASYSVLENAGSVAIEIQRTGPATDFGTVWVRTWPDSAESEDFQFFGDIVTFEPGQSNLTLNLGIRNDTLVEQPETFQIVLSDPDPFCCQLGSNVVATITIQDNDLGIQFASDFYSVSEDAAELLVEVSRFGDIANEWGEITFDVLTNSAIRNTHFTIASNVVAFAPGQTNAFIHIGIVNDALPEAFREFMLVFQPDPDPFCCSLGQIVATRIVIEDNDHGVEFSEAMYSVSEDAKQVVISIVRGGDLIAREGHVTFTIQNGSALASADYEVPFADYGFVFAAGQSNWSFAINILNDALVEGTELFSLSLVADPFNLPLGVQGIADVLILDNDFGVEFSELDASVGEQGGSIQIQVQRIGDPTNAFSVDLIAGGTATSGTDFVLPTNRLYFAAGQTNLALSIPVFDDPFVEGEEIIQLALTNATAGVPLGFNARAPIHLFDNEYPVNMIDQSFQPPFWGLSAALMRADGKILVGSPLMLCRPEGSIERMFNPQLYGITALAEQPDGKILCGGTFGIYVAPNYQYYLTRYQFSGDRDTSFVSPLGFSSSVRCIQAQPDGGILVGGEIFRNTVGVRHGIVRLSYWGEWDNSFEVAPDVWRVDAILVQPGGNIIIAGPFTSVDGSVRPGIARLFSNGWLDDNFDAGLSPGSAVFALAAQADGDLLAVVGSNRVVRLSGVDGFTDLSFQTQLGANSLIQTITVQPDGRILLLGDIFGSDNNRLGAIVRLNTDGSLDGSFSSFVGSGFVGWHDERIFTAHNGSVVRLLASTPASGLSFATNRFYVSEGQSGGSVLLERHGNTSSSLAVDFIAAGDALPGEDYLPGSGTIIFSPLETQKEVVTQIIDNCRAEPTEMVEITLTNAAAGVAISPLGWATLSIVDDDTPGSLDGFNPTFHWATFPTNYFYLYPPAITAMALQPDGKIIIGRDGVIVRINSDGTQDRSFAHGATICGVFGSRGPGIMSCRVNTIVLEPDGGILAGGVGSVIRLDRNGVVDSNFAVTALSYGNHGEIYSGSIERLLLQPDGKILVLGSYSRLNGYFQNPIRLNADSSMDTSFRPDQFFGWSGLLLALLPDGKFIAGSGVMLSRLNPDGSRDEDFPIVYADGAIQALAILPDQRILIGGSFRTVSGEPRLALARLHPNGSLDGDFTPSIWLDDAENMTAVEALCFSQDHNIFVAGSFPDGITRIVKTDSGGMIISNFNSGLRFSGPAFYTMVNDMVEQPKDGKLLVAGRFEAVNSVPRRGLARLVSERSYIQLAPPALQPDGSLRIVTGSHGGESYVLQKSAEMSSWISVSTNTAVDCTVELIDPAPSPQSGFYRAMKID
jgi:uncharacterized delta-60 repeat protein